MCRGMDEVERAGSRSWYGCDHALVKGALIAIAAPTIVGNMVLEARRLMRRMGA